VGGAPNHAAADFSLETAVRMPMIVFRWRYESLDASLLVALAFAAPLP
jgi:hypothetical protein